MRQRSSLHTISFCLICSLCNFVTGQATLTETSPYAHAWGIYDGSRRHVRRRHAHQACTRARSYDPVILHQLCELVHKVPRSQTCMPQPAVLSVRRGVGTMPHKTLTWPANSSQLALKLNLTLHGCVMTTAGFHRWRAHM